MSSKKIPRKESNESISSMSNYSVESRSFSVDSRSYSIDSTISGEMEIKEERKEINEKFFIKMKPHNRRKREEPIISSSPKISDILKIMEQVKFNNKLTSKCE
jgi:hypothetical protein|tara:strand:- start:455 stop:763 length:309 start_codon:yes stop_codon:yes gene_type:complete